jgi:hypothetical protein
MRRITRRTWIGIGLAVVGDAARPMAFAQTAPDPRTADSATPRTGTGGEPYLRDGGPSDSRTRITRDLILFDGCLRVFDELMAAQSWSEARQRIDEATLDYREKLEPYMKGQAIKPFTPLVDEMTRALARRDGAAVKRARDKLQTRFVEADRALRKFRVPYHQFALRGSIEALKVASKSYASAYATPNQPEVADYQDGRGAFSAASATVASVSTDLRRIDQAAAERVVAELSGMRPIWPTLSAPPSPPFMSDSVEALVEAVEAAASPFWAKTQRQRT